MMIIIIAVTMREIIAIKSRPGKIIYGRIASKLNFPNFDPQGQVSCNASVIVTIVEI